MRSKCRRRGLPSSQPGIPLYSAPGLLASRSRLWIASPMAGTARHRGWSKSRPQHQSGAQSRYGAPRASELLANAYPTSRQRSRSSEPQRRAIGPICLRVRRMAFSDPKRRTSSGYGCGAQRPFRTSGLSRASQLATRIATHVHRRLDFGYRARSRPASAGRHSSSDTATVDLPHQCRLGALRRLRNRCRDGQR